MDPDRNQPIPLYFQLKAALLEDILSGRYGADGRLPTEYELCAAYGISRTPVTHALSELAREGVVLRHRRRGTFVNPHWVRRRADGELRVIVPDGPWGQQIRRAAWTGARLSVVAVPLEDLHAAFVRSVAEGLGPDLVVLDSVWVREFAADGFLLPLDEVDPDWIRGEYHGDFLRPFVTANALEGKTFAVQAEADVSGLWYRRKLFADLGLQAPRTWSDLREVGVALAAHPTLRHAIVLPGGSPAGETTTYCLLTLLASNGAEVFRDGKVVLNSPATVAALEFLRGLVADGVVPVEAVTYEWDKPMRLLAAGRAAVSFGGSYEAARLAAAAGQHIDAVTERFGFLAMPSGPSGTQVTLGGGMVYCISRQARQPGTAMRLLRRLVAPEALARMSRETGQLPTRYSAVRIVAAESEFLAMTADLLDRAVTRPATTSYALVSAQLQAMLEAVITRRLSPRGAVTRFAEMIAAVTGLPVHP